MTGSSYMSRDIRKTQTIYINEGLFFDFSAWQKFKLPDLG